MNLSSLLGRAAIYGRDLRALQRGRLAQRLTNRILGRAMSKLLRGVWR